MDKALVILALAVPKIIKTNDPEGLLGTQKTVDIGRILTRFGPVRIHTSPKHTIRTVQYCGLAL